MSIRNRSAIKQTGKSRINHLYNAGHCSQQFARQRRFLLCIGAFEALPWKRHEQRCGIRLLANEEQSRLSSQRAAQRNVTAFAINKSIVRLVASSVLGKQRAARNRIGQRRQLMLATPFQSGGIGKVASTDVRRRFDNPSHSITV